APSPKELAATAILALPLREVSVTARAAGAAEEPEDYELPHWAGVVPVRLVRGVPTPDEGVAVPVPETLRPVPSPWLDPVVLRGRHVVLEPLDRCHAADLFAALDDAEVHRYIPRPRPRSVADMAAA